MSDAISARRSISNFATLVAVLTAPVLAGTLIYRGVSLVWAVVVAAASILLFRGLIDLVLKRLIPQPTLFGADDPDAREDDALRKRRLHFWATFVKLTPLWALLAWKLPTALALVQKDGLQLIILPLYMFFNFAILFGPMMLMGVTQIRGFEPGDASWGVKLDDVRGQAEAKEEIRRVITLWQSGEQFVKAGGKRERGILFLGAPGTGKTMLAKAIATGFNCPIVTIPGSGFAQTFLGMDVVIVRFLARKARKLAKKWGGQCIVFIDEIDAVGMRRAGVQGKTTGAVVNPAGVVNQIPGGMFGGGMGSLALNQLLVVMDGIDSPPFFKRMLVNRINTFLDASYIVPRSIPSWRWDKNTHGTVGTTSDRPYAKRKRIPLRFPHAKPSGNQIFFVGATNVPLEALDPALVRAGRMGRHIYFRTPTKKDRIDIFDLYLSKVAHDDSLDVEELARITNGYSPAEIEQACSLALTYAHHAGRDAFNRTDILEAMVTLEAGTALGWGYDTPEEERATAIHEAGHAVCSALFNDNYESTRLSIQRRGRSGGHHMAVEINERTFKFRDELVDDLIRGLGAYAAELVFYGNNTQGVGGDLAMTSGLAGTMVGVWGMAPPDLGPTDRPKAITIGKRLLAVARDGDTKLPKDKYEDEAALMGYAFVVAYNTILDNEFAIEKIAERLVRDKEIYGDDLLALLDSCSLQKPISWEWPSELL